jgi:hypothetical protein
MRAIVGVAVAVVEGQSHQSVLPPTDIFIEEYMEDVIQEFDLQIDLGKHKADDSVSLFARKKGKWLNTIERKH